MLWSGTTLCVFLYPPPDFTAHDYPLHICVLHASMQQEMVVATQPCIFEVDKPGIQADRLLYLLVSK